MTSFAPTASTAVGRFGRALVGRARAEKRLPTDDPNDRALDKIPIAEAEIFRRFVRGERKQDIAVSEGYPITVVHSAISVARRAIRERIEREAAPADLPETLPRLFHPSVRERACLSDLELSILIVANVAAQDDTARLGGVLAEMDVRALMTRCKEPSLRAVTLALRTLQQRRTIVYHILVSKGRTLVLLAPWSNSAALTLRASQLIFDGALDALTSLTDDDADSPS